MENKFFQEALKDFTYDAAIGGAVEHLANQGYTPSKIREMLDFPVSFERVQETYWKCCIKNKIIVEDISDFANVCQKSHYVTEYDEYGRKSFRKVTENTAGVALGNAYILCDFGIRKYRDKDAYSRLLESLTHEQRSYIEEMPWKLTRVWHILDKRMSEIAKNLCTDSTYRTSVFLPDQNELVEINRFFGSTL